MYLTKKIDDSNESLDDLFEKAGLPDVEYLSWKLDNLIKGIVEIADDWKIND